MIKKFESFISDTNKDYDHEDIVVAIRDGSEIIKGRKYRLAYPQPTIDNYYIFVHDLYNNERICSHKNNFVTELEYELGDDTNKYNI